MGVASVFQKLHRRSPKLAKAASLTTATSVLTASSVVGGIPLWLMGAAKMLTGSKVADDVVIGIADQWIRNNNAVIDTVLPDRDWRISLPDDVGVDKQYLLICNHQSWVDTSIIQYISQDTLPLTRFFTKHELLYIPFVGQAFYFLDFPMMKRHSKEEIAKNPQLKGQDLQEAKRACELLKHKPFTLLNYLEGTRFTKEKQAAQQSPYTHLLKPRAGGMALAINALGAQIDGILDMTIVYPDGKPEYSDLWKGNIRRLGVDVRRIEMPEALFSRLQQGHYEEDAATKAALFAWLDDAWQQKDVRITQMLAEFETSSEEPSEDPPVVEG